MRIRFVTRAQLQVLQASRMERHTMWDGIIPLSGLSPSAVSRQWGVVNKVRANSDIVMPIAAIPYQVVGNDIANDGNSLCLSTYDYTIGKFKISGKRAQDDGSSKIWMQWIAICV